MGRAYAALADDANSIFQNPAGLCSIKSWQATSMYSKLIEEVDYSLLGLTRSLSREALGIGYVNASVGGSQLSKRDPVTDRIVPDSSGFIGYSSSVLLFTYAVNPDKYFSFPSSKELNLGANIKVFSQALTGIPSADVSALGFDLDLGMQYRPLSYLTLALAGYNLLPYNLGGKLMWGSGITESIPASAKAGMAFKLLGSGGFREIKTDDSELYLTSDYEFTPLGVRPQLWHLGLEWKKADLVSVRLGVDQDAVASGGGAVGINNNLSAGIGLTLFGIRFDYAFHTFGELAQNNTHFFSLSYGIEKEKPPVYVPPEPQFFIQLKEPEEKRITFDPYVMVKGQILEPARVKNVKVNGQEANLYPDGSFMQLAGLKLYGINRLEAIAYGPTGRILETRSVEAIRLKTFKDMKAADPLRQTIGAMAVLGYISGYKNDTIRLQAPITRKGLLEIMTKTGKVSMVIQGAKPLKANMNQALTRAEAVTMLVKYAGYKLPARLYERPFPDIEVKHWAAKEISAAKQNGLLEYLKGKKFNPKLKATRREIVDMMSRIEFVDQKIRVLLGR